MATLPSPRTWATSDEPTAVMLNTDLRDAYGMFWNPPRALVYRSTGQSITASTYTLLVWDSEWYDSDGMHSTSLNTSRLTCVTSGVYEVVVHIEWQVTNDPTPGTRVVTVQKNNNGGLTPFTSTEIAADVQIVEISDATGRPQTNHLTFLVALTVGDYLECVVAHTAASARSTVESAGNRTTFGMLWMGAT